MKRNGMVFITILNIILVGCLFFFLKKSQLVQSGVPLKALRIALLTPMTHPSLEQIKHGFCATLAAEGKLSYKVKVFNAQGDRKLMYAQAEEIVQGNYDLVFTIATSPSVMMHELLTKRGKKTPQVFGAVADPVGAGLVASLQLPGGNITGSVEDPDYEKQIALLRIVKPDITTVLLVYNPTQGSGLVKDKNRLEAIFARYGITLKTADVVDTNQIYAKVIGAINDCDVVMVLKDNTVVSGLDALVKMCNVHHKTLLATDFDSADRGAALSFGVCEDQYGAHAARYACQILEQNKMPDQLACTPPGTDRFKINLNAADIQGITLSEAQKMLFKHLEII